MMLNMKKKNKLNKVFGGLLICVITLASARISIAMAATNGYSENIKIETNDESIKNFLKEQVDELKNNINTSGAIKGSIVVINPETGEVLGTCSYNGE